MVVNIYGLPTTTIRERKAALAVQNEQKPSSAASGAVAVSHFPHFIFHSASEFSAPSPAVNRFVLATFFAATSGHEYAFARLRTIRMVRGRYAPMGGLEQWQFVLNVNDKFSSRLDICVLAGLIRCDRQRASE